MGKYKYIKVVKDVILKIFKSLNRFNSSNKINSHYRGENKEEKKIRINYRTNQNIRITINVFLRSQLSASFPHRDSQPTCASLGDPPIPAGGVCVC